MMIENQFKPGYAIPPMETLKELLEDRELALQQVAESADLPIGKLKAVMEGETAITEPIANGLEKALGIPANFWLNLEKNYQETLKRLANQPH